MNAQVARIEPSSAISGLTEDQLMAVLKTSVYPGARDDSIRMVMAYCQAAKLDPLQKPVHIVPMPVPTGRKDGGGYDIKETRDVIMPGIGLYRTQASRTNQYAGITEPEFGEEVVETLGGVETRYPKWCRITVEKVVAGELRRFSAKEFWLENYATKSSSTIAPNAMWKRRPYGQLSKCAEAQALRKAFPDTVGSAPTAEEMEGKEYGETIDYTTGEVVPGKPRVALPQAKSEQQGNETSQVQTGRGQQEAVRSQQPANTPPPEVKILSKNGNGSGAMIATEGEKNFLLNKMRAKDLTLEMVLEACGLSTFEGLTADGFIAMKEHIAQAND